MKMIIAILKDEDADHVSQALIAKDFRVTRLASTGGFLRRGSTTLLVGVEENLLDQAIQVIREYIAPPLEPGMRRATLFVLNVANYVQV